MCDNTLISCRKCKQVVHLETSPYCQNCHELNGPEPTVWEDHLLSSGGDIGPLMAATKRLEAVNDNQRKVESWAVWGTLIGVGLYIGVFLIFWGC